MSKRKNAKNNIKIASACLINFSQIHPLVVVFCSLKQSYTGMLSKEEHFEPVKTFYKYAFKNISNIK